MEDQMKSIQLRQLKEEDIDILTPIMKRAFNQDAMMHIGKLDGPIGYDDGTLLRR